MKAVQKFRAGVRIFGGTYEECRLARLPDQFFRDVRKFLWSQWYRQ